MPVYSLSSHSPITEDQKLKLVHAITDVHCGLTGAPEQFVHVLFADGIPIREGKKLYIQANVRFGRSENLIAEMKQQLIDACSKALNTDQQDLIVNLLEIHASWIMEGGYVMPEPGEEEEWMENVQNALSER